MTQNTRGFVFLKLSPLQEKSTKPSSGFHSLGNAELFRKLALAALKL